MIDRDAEKRRKIESKVKRDWASKKKKIEESSIKEKREREKYMQERELERKITIEAEIEWRRLLPLLRHQHILATKLWVLRPAENRGHGVFVKVFLLSLTEIKNYHCIVQTKTYFFQNWQN